MDMTGMGQGFREEHDTAHNVHVAGMLQHKEFVNAVTTLIPNWAEIMGMGSLSKLFRALDDNKSGYLSFEKLMGCKMDDEMASYELDNFCQRRPMEHCPFRRA